jgi:spermidine/putrescine transport system permease protein
MILPIYTVLTKIDPSVVEAAQDLGAGRRQVLWRVTFPLTISGVMSGVTMTFMPAVSTFIISKLLGGGQPLIGDLIESQFMAVGDWGFGSAMSVILMILVLLTMGFVSRYEKEQEEGGRLL